MRRLSWMIGLCALFVSASWFASSQPVSGQQRGPTTESLQESLKMPMTLRDFMRKKLTASNQILEGLALDDMALVKEGATTLNHLSVAEKWRVRTDPIYRQFSDEFTRNTSELIKATESNNLDQAALKWMAATMNCIECHRFVRNNLIVGESR